MSTTFRKNGFEITKDYGDRIISVVCGINGFGREVKLGQRVYSNGRILVPEGVLGIIVKINEPDCEGRTTNIFDVWFEDHDHTTSMKIKDLKF